MTLNGTIRGVLAGIMAALFCSSCSRQDSPLSSASNPPLLIEPRTAMGDVHAGMRTQEIIQKFGEPQRRTANALEYTRLGFAVMPGQDGIVQVVMCGDVTGINGPLVKAFTGKTKEGIGLTSTKEEVLKAYGEPTATEKFRDGTESLQYDPLGITFTLEKSKVYHMIVRLSPKDNSPSVTLEPPTTTSAR